MCKPFRSFLSKTAAINQAHSLGTSRCQGYRSTSSQGARSRRNPARPGPAATGTRAGLGLRGEALPAAGTGPRSSRLPHVPGLHSGARRSRGPLWSPGSSPGAGELPWVPSVAEEPGPEGLLLDRNLEVWACLRSALSARAVAVPTPASRSRSRSRQPCAATCPTRTCSVPEGGSRPPVRPPAQGDDSPALLGPFPRAPPRDAHASRDRITLRRAAGRNPLW